MADIKTEHRDILQKPFFVSILDHEEKTTEATDKFLSIWK